MMFDVFGYINGHTEWINDVEAKDKDSAKSKAEADNPGFRAEIARGHKK